jgi:hypothetical protein
MRSFAMTRLKTFAVALALVPVLLLAGARLSDAWPGSYSYLTFSAPVSVPGASLQAGTYVFRRPLDTPGVLQVMSRDSSHVYSTFMTIPTTRAKSTSDTKIVFGETSRGTAPPIRVWFPADSLTGYQFVY